MNRCRFRLLWAAVCLLCLAALGLMVRGDRRTAAELTPQLAAARWETRDKPYAMASVFLEAEQAIPQTRLGEMYLNVENALTAGGVSSESHPWIYAASYAREAVLRSGGASCDAELTAVAGDFFQIHPMALRSGWYLREDDVMRDRIVLDRRAAWDLFSSDNVAGQFLELNGVTLQVAAVVDEESGADNELAAGEIRRAWVFWDCPALSGTETDFTCLEAVLPQPVKNFAGSTLQSALGNMLPEKTAVTDNSARFGLKNRWSVLRSIAVRGVTTGAVAYPYWENAARLTENRLALRLVPEAILLAVPVFTLIILLLRYNRRRTWGLHSIRDAAENAIDKKHRRAWDKTHPPHAPTQEGELP